MENCQLLNALEGQNMVEMLGDYLSGQYSMKDISEEYGHRNKQGEAMVWIKLRHCQNTLNARFDPWLDPLVNFCHRCDLNFKTHPKARRYRQGRS